MPEYEITDEMWYEGVVDLNEVLWACQDIELPEATRIRLKGDSQVIIINNKFSQIKQLIWKTKEH